MPGSFVRCTQILDSLCVLVHNNNVVLRMRFFLAAVGVFLLFRIAWPLTLAFGSINEKIVQFARFKRFP